MNEKELLKELNYRVEHLEINNDYIESLLPKAKETEM